MAGCCHAEIRCSTSYRLRNPSNWYGLDGSFDAAQTRLHPLWKSHGLREIAGAPPRRTGGAEQGMGSGFSRSPNADTPAIPVLLTRWPLRLSPSRWRTAGAVRTGSAGLSIAGTVSGCQPWRGGSPSASPEPTPPPARSAHETAGPTRRDDADYGGGAKGGDKSPSCHSRRSAAKSGNPCKRGASGTAMDPRSALQAVGDDRFNPDSRALFHAWNAKPVSPSRLPRYSDLDELIV